MDLFFISSKLIWAVIRPGNLLVLGIIIGCLALLFKTGWIRRVGKTMLVLTVITTIIIAFLPVGDWAIRPLERQYEYPENVSQLDGIIVLGGGISLPQSVNQQSMQLNADGDRIAEMLALMSQFPSLPVIYTGGSGEITIPDRHSIDYLRRYLQRLDIAVDRVTFETRARNTYQNAKFSHDLIKPTPDQQWGLVTSAYHMPRARAVFKNLGWNVIPLPVDYKTRYRPSFTIAFDFSENLGLLDVAMREYLGLLAYHMTGRIE